MRFKKTEVQWVKEKYNIINKIKKPLIAIGGINDNNIDSVLGQGVKSVAVISAVVSSDDVRGTAFQLVSRIKKIH